MPPFASAWSPNAAASDRLSEPRLAEAPPDSAPDAWELECAPAGELPPVAAAADPCWVPQTVTPHSAPASREDRENPGYPPVLLQAQEDDEDDEDGDENDEDGEEDGDDDDIPLDWPDEQDDFEEFDEEDFDDDFDDDFEEEIEEDEFRESEEEFGFSYGEEEEE